MPNVIFLNLFLYYGEEDYFLSSCWDPARTTI